MALREESSILPVNNSYNLQRFWVHQDVISRKIAVAEDKFFFARHLTFEIRESMEIDRAWGSEDPRGSP